MNTTVKKSITRSINTIESASSEHSQALVRLKRRFLTVSQEVCELSLSSPITNRLQILRELLKVRGWSLEANTIFKVTGTVLKENGGTFVVKRNKVKLENVDAVIFDEAYPYSTANKKRMVDLMDAHPNIKFILTFDPLQLSPINDTSLSREAEKKYNADILYAAAPNVITLKISKRLESEEDKIKMKEIRDIVKEGKMDKLEFMRKYFKCESSMEKMKGYGLCYFNKTAATVNKFKQDQEPVTDDKNAYTDDGITYYTGLELRCRKHFRFGANRKMFVNNTYKIKKMMPRQKKMIMSDIDTEEVFILNYNQFQYFLLKGAGTVHSHQGSTIDGPIGIYDADHPFVTWEWLYVAITRTRRLSDVTFFLRKEKPEDFDSMLVKKIRAHKLEDTKKKRLWTDSNYITPAAIKRMIQIQDGCCKYCQEALEVKGHHQLSINRINNNLAHIRTNCEISCLSCNHQLQ